MLNPSKLAVLIDCRGTAEMLKRQPGNWTLIKYSLEHELDEDAAIPVTKENLVMLSRELTNTELDGPHGTTFSIHALNLKRHFHIGVTVRK